MPLAYAGDRVRGPSKGPLAPQVAVLLPILLSLSLRAKWSRYGRFTKAWRSFSGVESAARFEFDDEADQHLCGFSPVHGDAQRLSVTGCRPKSHERRPPTERCQVGNVPTLVQTSGPALEKINMMAVSDGFALARRRAFGAAVRARRMALGLSQEELASRATFERKSVSRVENGSYAPSLDRLWRLADALDVPLHTLLRAAEVERIGRR